MNSKELISAGIEFKGPEKLPLRYAFTPEKSDIVSVHYLPDKKWKPKREGEDEWGCVWDTLEGRVISSFGQVKEHPIKTVRDYENYQFPDPHALGRFENVQVEIDKYKEKYTAAGMGFHDFNRLMFLRGVEQLFEDLLEHKIEVVQFLRKLVDWQIEIIEEYLNFDIDAVWFGDDWGTQQSLMISPKLWREVFKPGYKRQFDLVHSHGKHVIFHSCGYIWEIIPDFIEIGVDAFNFNQPRIFGLPEISGIDRLAETFGGKVCFICPVDMQKTLIEGTLEQIKAEAHHLVKSLGKYNGGFIACCDEGIDHGYIPIERIEFMGKMFESLRESKKCGHIRKEF